MNIFFFDSFKNSPIKYLVVTTVLLVSASYCIFSTIGLASIAIPFSSFMINRNFQGLHNKIVFLIIAVFGGFSTFIQSRNFWRKLIKAKKTPDNSNETLISLFELAGLASIGLLLVLCSLQFFALARHQKNRIKTKKASKLRNESLTKVSA